jgi:hypothetical protein
MRGTTFAANLPRIIDAFLDDDSLTVCLEDGRTVSVPVAWYPRLAYGSARERANFQISSAGYGIHWPDLDEDIGVEGLLLGKRSMESRAAFERWLRARRSAEQDRATGLGI